MSAVSHVPKRPSAVLKNLFCIIKYVWCALASCVNHRVSVLTKIKVKKFIRFRTTDSHVPKRPSAVL